VRGGERRLVEWSGTPVTDQFGLTRLILSGVDVTERVHQAAELRRSRARIVAAGDAERQRLQRNLHDGAQQQLVFVSHALRLARGALEHDRARAAELLETAIETMDSAHAELRELARGLHPALLSERGLPSAVRALASRAPLPVQIEAAEGERLPAHVETAAYYVVAEALTNVAKYARADAAVVRVRRHDATAVIEIEDDGIGGADMAAGSGLRGLADRVEALAGTLAVESPPGGGTRLRAELPTDGAGSST
jgi:signal transduction histidine kinase